MVVMYSDTVQDLLVYLTAILGVVLPGVVFILLRKAHKLYYQHVGNLCNPETNEDKAKSSDLDESGAKVVSETFKFLYDDEDMQERDKMEIQIFYASQTGTSKYFSGRLAEKIRLGTGGLAEAIVNNVETMDPEVLFSIQGIVIFIVSTYENGCPPEKCRWFFDWLSDTASDFRVSSSALSNMKYSIFGVGSTIYQQNFNKVAKRLHKDLAALEAKEILKIHLSDENDSEISLDEQFDIWCEEMIKILRGNNDHAVNGATEKDAEEKYYETELESEDAGSMMDIEDLAPGKNIPIKNGFRDESRSDVEKI